MIDHEYYKLYDIDSLFYHRLDRWYIDVQVPVGDCNCVR